MDTLLTVIVPCYNGEKTLRRAMDSLLKQTHTAIEIIIINDGSKDCSGKLADEFASSDSRVRVIHKPVNEGLSAGRNTGMNAARGDYITFLDCDDWVEPDMYEVLLRDHNNADIIVTGAFHDVWSAEAEVAVTTRDEVGESCVTDDRREIVSWAARLDEKRLFAYTWNKLYRRQFLQNCGTLFAQQTLIEDYLFNCTVWQQVTKLKIVDGCYYHYVKWSNEALTQKYLPDYFTIMDKRYVLMRDLLKRNDQLSGTVCQIVGNMHIKHIISGMVKNCAPKAAMSAKMQRQVIRECLADPNCREAIGFAKGKRKQEKLCNAVFSLGNVTVLHNFAKLLYKMQNSKGHLFDKLK